MAEFIQFEAEHSDNESLDSDSNISEHNSFINDESESENQEFYGFTNVQVDLEQTNRDAYARGLERIENCDEYSNLCADSDDEISSIDEFDKSEQLVLKFKKDLLPNMNLDLEKIVHNEFTRVILYTIRNLITNEKNVCDILELKQNAILNEISEKFSYHNFQFSLDLQEFNHIAYQVNNILLEFKYFLPVFEQKNKYRQFIVTKPEKQNQIKQLSSCLIEKYNGFQVVKVDFSKKQRQQFQPIDIIYIPTKNPTKLPECYYTLDV